MRCWVLTPDAQYPMRLEHRPDPRLAPTQVRVGLRAASLNYRDLIMCDRPPRPGLVPVSDGAGEIIEVGSGVTGLQVGDRVVGAFFADWAGGPPRHANLQSALGGDLDGVLAEHFILEAAATVKIPDGLSFAAASAFPCAAVTAWHALIGHDSPLGTGDVVLTLGTGGVSMFAFQIARLRGARVIATSSSAEKLERLRTLGADAVFSYASAGDWAAEVGQPTEGRGVDFVVETGGAATVDRSLNACARGGCVTLVGGLSGRAATVDASLIHSRGLTLRSIYVGPLTMLREALQAFADAGERPLISRSFEFGDAPAAFGYLRESRHFGKVIIEC